MFKDCINIKNPRNKQPNMNSIMKRLDDKRSCINYAGLFLRNFLNRNTAYVSIDKEKILPDFIDLKLNGIMRS